jgi:hypothetical protein
MDRGRSKTIWNKNKRTAIKMKGREIVRLGEAG